MKPMIRLIVFTLSLNANLFAQSGWSWQNPLPQGNTLWDIQVFDQNTALAVGDAGTVMKTTDGGINWHVQHYAGGTAETLNSVYFIDADTGWAAGAAGTILKTTNGGSTWSAQTSETTVDLSSVYFIPQGGTDTGWAIGKVGTILKTTNGGSTWSTQISGTTEDLTSVSFIDANIGWAVGVSGTILKTTTGGSTWSVQTSGTTIDLSSVYFTDANTGWAVGTAGTILKTINGGSAWSAQTSGTISSLLSVYFKDANTGWVVGGDDTILKTTNGGSTWSAQTSGTTSFLLSVDFMDANTGWAVGFSGTILKTTNGGNTWSAQTSGTTIDLSSVYFVPQGGTNTGWVVGGDFFEGIILKTTDGGNTWSAQTSGTTKGLHSVFFVDTNTGWAVGDGGTILKTNNGGSTWSAQTSGTTSFLWSVYFVDANTGWAVGGDFFEGIILKTTNGGNTWSAQTGTGTISHLSSVYFIPQGGSNTGWAVGGGGTILKTTNGGSTWSAQTSGTTNYLSSVYFIPQSGTDTGWAVGDNGTILKTTNGGSTWSAQISETTSSLQSVYFMDANTGWAVGTGGTILKTTNGGTTWSAQISGTANVLSSVYFIPQGGSNTGWAVGRGGTILKTTSGETAFLNVDVQEVAIQAKPGETGTSTFKLSNTGTADLSFNITASGPTNTAPIFSAVLETRLSGAINSSSPRLPPLALNEINGEKPKTSQAQAVKTQAMNITAPAVVGDDVLFLDDGNDTPDNFIGLQGTDDTFWLNRFVPPGNGFQLERVLVFARTDSVSNPSLFVAVDTDSQRLVEGYVTLPPARDGTWYEISLPTPLSFESGQAFFIILGAPKAIAFPAGADQNASVSNNSFYFEPTLNAYVPLSTVKGFENGAFLIRAVGTKTAARLTVDPVSGTISPSGTQTINVTIDAQSLAVGDYQGQISITSNGGNRNIPVRIRVSNTTGVEDKVAGLLHAFRLEQNYPNPFNPETGIRYTLPFAANVSLSVFDLNGRRVASLEAGMKTAGEHVVRWDGRDSAGNRVPSGVYFYRLETTSPAGTMTVLTKKMTVMK